MMAQFFVLYFFLKLSSNVCKKPLTSTLVQEILDLVKTKTAKKEEINVERIPMAAFLTTLRRFIDT